MDTRTLKVRFPQGEMNVATALPYSDIVGLIVMNLYGASSQRPTRGSPKSGNTIQAICGEHRKISQVLVIHQMGSNSC